MKSRISMIVAGLFCALAVLAVLSPAAAPGSPRAGGAAALQGKVRIQISGWHIGLLPGQRPHRRISYGRFILSGAISDRGRFEDYRRLNVGRFRALVGSKGTIMIAFAGRSAYWTITKGTRVYTGLRGRGWGKGPHSPGPFEITMTGRVWQ